MKPCACPFFNNGCTSPKSSSTVCVLVDNRTTGCRIFTADKAKNRVVSAPAGVRPTTHDDARANKQRLARYHAAPKKPKEQPADAKIVVHLTSAAIDALNTASKRARRNAERAMSTPFAALFQEKLNGRR